MEKTYSFTLERINGTRRVTDYQEKEIFVSNSPDKEGTEIIKECRNMVFRLGLAEKVKFTIGIGE